MSGVTKEFSRLLINNYLIYYEGFHCLFRKSHKPCLHSYLQLGITVKWRLDYDENENMANLKKKNKLTHTSVWYRRNSFPQTHHHSWFENETQNFNLGGLRKKKLFRTSVWYGRRPFAQTHHHPWAHECLKINKKMSWKIKLSKK